VAQNFPTTAQAIYDVLAADANLAPYVGQYTFNNMATLPAMSVLTPGDDLPLTKSVTGIEIVIHDTGNIEDFPYLTDTSRLCIHFPVFLICWDGATGADLTAATEIILRRFMGSSSMQTVAASDGIGAKVQNKIIIKSDLPIVP